MNEVIVHDDSPERFSRRLPFSTMKPPFDWRSTRSSSAKWKPPGAMPWPRVKPGQAPVALITSEGMIIERRQRTRRRSRPRRSIALSLASADNAAGSTWIGPGRSAESSTDSSAVSACDAAAGFGGCARRRRAGLLARGGRRSGQNDAPPRGDEGARSRLARVSSRRPGGGRTLLTQTAFFEPRGLFGLLYWYVLYPVHGLIFSGLIRSLADQATALDNATTPNHHAFRPRASLMDFSFMLSMVRPFE